MEDPGNECGRGEARWRQGSDSGSEAAAKAAQRGGPESDECLILI